MTESDVLMVLYGLSTWGASLNFPSWARLLWRRWREQDRPQWWLDARLLIRIGLTMLSLGIAGLAGARLFGAVFFAMPITMPSNVGVGAIWLMSAAEPFFLRVAELNARERGLALDPPRALHSRAWRIYWIGVLSMGLCVALVMFSIYV